MKWAAALLGAAACLVTACDKQTEPLSRADFPSDREYARYFIDCANKAQKSGLDVGPAERACQRWSRPRRFRGIFLQEFEGNQFIENAMPSAHYTEPAKTVWFTVGTSEDSAAARQLKQNTNFHAIFWYVDVIGRKTLDENLGQGHMGVFDQEIAVDRVIAVKRLQSVPGYAGPDLLTRKSFSSDNRR